MMLAVVPPISGERGQIDAADESLLAINHDRFLVVAMAELCGIVQLAPKVSCCMFAERLLGRLHLFGGWFDDGRRSTP
jgi:hypothetical protein